MGAREFLELELEEPPAPACLERHDPNRAGDRRESFRGGAEPIRELRQADGFARAGTASAELPMDGKPVLRSRARDYMKPRDRPSLRQPSVDVLFARPRVTAGPRWWA
jgi:hypothetical protein